VSVAAIVGTDPGGVAPLESVGVESVVVDDVDVAAGVIVSIIAPPSRK
jgi:hypothetical protein